MSRHSICITGGRSVCLDTQSVSLAVGLCVLTLTLYHWRSLSQVGSSSDIFFALKCTPATIKCTSNDANIGENIAFVTENQ